MIPTPSWILVEGVIPLKKKSYKGPTLCSCKGEQKPYKMALLYIGKWGEITLLIYLCRVYNST